MLVFFAVSFLASIAGAICGIGGGVIIKPVLDLCQAGDAALINFLSGCTVLSMSCYSVGKAMRGGDNPVKRETGLPLAMGAALGGLAGKQMFSIVRASFENQRMVGAVQAICLGIITVGTLLYTVNKSRIRTHQIRNTPLMITVGLALGVMSSFLGIGGGPINLVVLFYFFSMDTKTAAANSLYIILFSQLASLLSTLLTRSVPVFEWPVLALMVCGGIGGGATGRILNRKLDNRMVDKLFMALMVVIIGICVYNTWSGLNR